MDPWTAAGLILIGLPLIFALGVTVAPRAQ